MRTYGHACGVRAWCGAGVRVVVRWRVHAQRTTESGEQITVVCAKINAGRQGKVWCVAGCACGEGAACAMREPVQNRAMRANRATERVARHKQVQRHW